MHATPREGEAHPLEVLSRSPEETQALGRALGEAARPGDVFLLVGELGAGKTCLVQGIAWGLGVEGWAASPSFVLVREHQGRLPFYHIDFYRLESALAAAELGLDDYLCGEGVVAVEWADRAMEALPPEHLLVELEHRSERGRSIRLEPRGQRYEELVSQLGLCPSTSSGWPGPQQP